MNLVTLGLGGALLITFGLLGGEAEAMLETVCVTFDAPSVSIEASAPSVTVTFEGCP